MTTQKENKRITPKGKALYPKLRAPDKFNEAAEPRYKISVQFDHEGTKYMQDLIQKELEKAKGSDNFKGKKWSKNPFLGYSENDQGEVTFNFYTKAEVVSKKTKEIFKKPPIPVFDAKLVPFNGVFGNGSTVRVDFSPTAYHTSSTVCGVALYLNAVQLLELVEYGSGKNASDFGFGEEEGFTGEATGFEPDTGDTESDEF